jgi:hypothetical protein
MGGGAVDIMDITSGVEIGAGVEIPTAGSVQAKSPRKNMGRNLLILWFVCPL